MDNAVRLIEADTRRCADTHLLRYPLPSAWCDGVDVALYLKDESTHITGSLKHRLARPPFLYALCNGWIAENTTVIEASSGSTAVSEAYFAALLGLPFIAVMPSSTSFRVNATCSRSPRSRAIDERGLAGLDGSSSVPSPVDVRHDDVPERPRLGGRSPIRRAMTTSSSESRRPSSGSNFGVAVAYRRAMLECADSSMASSPLATASARISS